MEDAAGIRHSAVAIEALMQREIERGVRADQIVLAGFSQGCAMVLFTGLRYAEKLAGVIALSGYLPMADTMATERSAANQHTPIFMAHGQRDAVIALDRASSSRDALAKLGYAVDWHEYPMEHSVCMEEVQALGAWLVRVLR